MTKPIGWELYRSFLAVLAEGSLSGAARALDITQPTVGRHIAALERALADGLPGKRARVDALGYMPRGNVGAISAVDAREAFDAGAFAVTVAEQGGGSVALQYDGGKTVLRKVPLEAVAGKTRHMPDDFLKPGANQLSEAGMAYLRRLVPAKYKVGKPFV